MTPLHYCLLNGSIKCLEELLKLKPETNILSKSGMTPLEASLVNDNIEILSYASQQEYEDL